LLEDNHVLFSNMPPQLIYFNRYVSGLDVWPKSLWYTATGLGMFGIWTGASTLIGALISCRKHPGWRKVAKRGLLIIILGFAWWKIVLEIFRVHTDATPLTSMPIVLVAVILTLSGRAYRAWRKKASLSLETSMLFVIAAFAQISILR